MTAVARKRGHTSLNPVPRKRIACENETKWVDGDTCITVRTQSSWLSSGVFDPDKIFIGIATRI